MQLRLLAPNQHEANRRVLSRGLQRAIQIHFSHGPTLSPWSVGPLRPTLRGSARKKHSQAPGQMVHCECRLRTDPARQDRSCTHRLLQWLHVHRLGGQVPAGLPWQSTPRQSPCLCCESSIYRTLRITVKLVIPGRESMGEAPENSNEQTTPRDACDTHINTADSAGLRAAV